MLGQEAVQRLRPVVLAAVAALPVRGGEVVVQEQRQVLRGRMPAPTECPLDRGVIGGVDDDDEQVTPREPGVGEMPQPFAVADQLELGLGGVLVDQVDERIDSPSVTRMNS